MVPRRGGVRGGGPKRDNETLARLQREERKLLSGRERLRSCSKKIERVGQQADIVGARPEVSFVKVRRAFGVLDKTDKITK